MSERRYTDEEVKRILDTAAESDAALTAGVTGEHGMSLAEIQRIAAEAGFSPASVTAAADALDRAPPPPVTQSVLGLRVGVGQSVTLSRDLDDAEWRRLVAFLRETFEAQGREEQVAGRREWRNGNLRVAVESLGDTALLTMRTRKESAQGFIRTGIALMVGSLVFATATALTQTGGQAFVGVAMMALGGGAMAGAAALQLPSWSAARQKQFEAVAEYARRLSAGEGA